MNSTPQIFKDRFINGKLSRYSSSNIPDFKTKYAEICRWYNATTEKYLDKTKETEVQGLFMTRLFNQVLGYSVVMDEGEIYHQQSESKSILDTTESDGALGFFNKRTGAKDVRVVIELKDARTPLDKKQNRTSHLTPVEQAFSYANKNGSKCGWVIVSNFVETRLYKSNSSLEYEVFDMTKMNKESEFIRFYYFLCREHLIAENGKSLIDELYQENEAEGVDITNQFYKTYKSIRDQLFASLKENNPDVDELLLFTKSQKLMDRFIFICFCEDCDLLPRNIYSKLIETAKSSYSFAPNKLWDQLRGLFASIDKGNPPMKINQYNGGLFKPDPELDNLSIPDETLESFIQLSTYDFNSDLNVNILGQIFEQSISDVEHIKSEINGEDATSKQKDDGIFYTPYYVTRYIVEQTVGKYLEQKKEELKHSIFSEGPISVVVKKVSTRREHEYKFTSLVPIPMLTDDMTEDDRLEVRAAERLHLIYWNAYEEVLKNIKVCDPACGSGAFLNQCFDYLHEEMDFVLGMKTHLDGQISLFDIDKQILQNNLFGVDINQESVEITKLSLWLKTAKNDQTLASLDNNIKCGNSIVSDFQLVPNAFDWQNEFPDVFANGGFDIIIGNPPYGAKLNQIQKDYLTDNYVTTEYNFDTYKTFFELGFNILKTNGYLGYITPNTFFTLELGAKKLRKFLFDNTLCRIVEVFNVFPSAVVEPVITVFQKKIPQNEEFTSICLPRHIKLSSTFLNEGMESTFTQQDLKKDQELIFNYRSSKEDIAVCNSMKENPRLDTLFNVMTGAKPYQVGKGVPPQTREIVDTKPFNGYVKIDDSWKPYMRGRTIGRYVNRWSASGEYIKYGEWLAEPRDKAVFDGEKLFVRQTGDQLVATYDNGNVSNDTLYSIYPKDNNEINLLYLLGILNSTLMNWYYQTENYLEVGKPMAQVKANAIRKLPIAISEQEIEPIVEAILSLCQKRHDTKQKFLHYIKSSYEPKGISEKLENFENLSFKEFCDELKKQKVKLSSYAKIDLLPLFEDQIKEISAITAQIKEEQLKLDDAIFTIYEIDENTKERIKKEFVIDL